MLHVSICKRLFGKRLLFGRPAEFVEPPAPDLPRRAADNPQAMVAIARQRESGGAATEALWQFETGIFHPCQPFVDTVIEL